MIEYNIEKTIIQKLIGNYFNALDEEQIDLKSVEEIFTETAHVIMPNGFVTIGYNNIIEEHKKSFDRFKSTHHIMTRHVIKDYAIDLNETNAILEANLTAIHLWVNIDEDPLLDFKYFLVGGILSAKAIKIDNNWLISELTNRNVWKTGKIIQEIINDDRPSINN